jgi:hypothetical protein
MIPAIENSSFTQTAISHVRKNKTFYSIVAALVIITGAICSIYEAHTQSSEHRLRTGQMYVEITNRAPSSIKTLHRYIHKIHTPKLDIFSSN